jgi:hypothetical protein
LQVDFNLKDELVTSLKKRDKMPLFSSQVIGYFNNEYGSAYCDIYCSDNLSEQQMEEIHQNHLQNGDVYRQCTFMSLVEARKMWKENPQYIELFESFWEK